MYFSHSSLSAIGENFTTQTFSEGSPPYVFITKLFHFFIEKELSRRDSVMTMLRDSNALKQQA